jgi:hypothetical protein
MTDQIEANENEKSLLQSLTREDVKLFIITILATVIANIVTVVVVAVAVILARSGRPHPATPGNYAINFSLSIVPMILLWAGVSPLLRTLAKSKTLDLSTKVLRWVIIILLALLGMITLIYVLTWIGFASGIH